MADAKAIRRRLLFDARKLACRRISVRVLVGRVSCYTGRVSEKNGIPHPGKMGKFLVLAKICTGD